ncbi:MAG TPA: hypothetical protein VKX49_00220 [Bryobacteraceae bacterium]|nr:hypothetical protein [Bryobacteraceae bacterium]
MPNLLAVLLYEIRILTMRERVQQKDTGGVQFGRQQAESGFNPIMRLRSF